MKDSPSLKHLEEALRLCFKGFRGLFFICVVAFLLSGIHTVPQGHEGRIMRLGQWLPTVEEAGLHFAWPPFWDRVYLYNLQERRTLSLERFAAPNRELRHSGDKALLTSGGQLIHTRWTLHYRLSNPITVQNRFGSTAPDAVDPILKEGLSSILIAHTAARSVDSLLQEQRNYSASVKEQLNRLFSIASTGLELLDLGLDEITVPEVTRPAFDEVQRQWLAQDRLRQDALNLARTLQSQLLSKRSEALGQAQSRAESLKAELRAEAKSLKALVEDYSPQLRRTYLDLRLQKMLRDGLAKNRDQSYWLQPEGELRLQLSGDPKVEELRLERSKQP